MNWLQSVDFWLKAGPTVAALIVPLLTYLWLALRMARYQAQLNRNIERYKTDLSKEIEGYKMGVSKELEHYKADISKELENHKFQLQSTFQVKFYEFQTRYSLLHQKRAEAIEKLFALLTRVQNDLQIWAAWDVLSPTSTLQIPDSIEEFYAKTMEHFQDLSDFFDEKRIYFDEDIKKNLLQIVRTASMLFESHHNIEFTRKSYPDLAAELKARAGLIIDGNIHPVISQLESKFKRLLSAEVSASVIPRA